MRGEAEAPPLSVHRVVLAVCSIIVTDDHFEPHAIRYEADGRMSVIAITQPERLDADTVHQEGMNS